MRIGFTGTRFGMTIPQSQMLRRWLLIQPKGEIETHDGDCVGADAEFRTIIGALFCDAVTHSHPCDITKLRAYQPANYTHDPLPPLDRNKIIVDSCDVLVAAPDEPERVRSGTWSTVRYARQVRRQLAIIMPDGSIVEENEARQ